MHNQETPADLMAAALRGWLAIFSREGSYVSPLVTTAIRDTEAAIAAYTQIAAQATPAQATPPDPAAEALDDQARARDAVPLRYAGMMGHTYCVIIDHDDGTRRIAGETCDLDEARRWAAEHAEADANPAIYRKAGDRWMLTA